MIIKQVFEEFLKEQKEKLSTRTYKEYKIIIGLFGYRTLEDVSARFMFQLNKYGLFTKPIDKILNQKDKNEDYKKIRI